jgi:hypothetical protein
MSPLSEKPTQRILKCQFKLVTVAYPRGQAAAYLGAIAAEFHNCGGAAGEHHQILMADRNCETCFAVVRNVRLVTRPPSVHSPKPGCNYACHIIRSPGSFSGVVLLTPRLNP